MIDAELPLEGADLLRFVYTCPLALVLIDAQGKITLLNGAATSLLMPFACDGELDNLFSLIEQSEPTIRDFLVAETAKSKHQPVYRRVRMDVQSIDRSFHLAFTFGTFDNGYSVTIQDVTDAVAKEKENKELLANEAYQRGRVEVASGILHDLGNALTGIAARAVDIRGRTDTDSVGNNLDRLIEFLAPHVQGLDSVLGAGKGPALLTMLEAMRADLQSTRSDTNKSANKMLAFIAHAQELLSINRTFAAPGSDPAKGSASLPKVIDDLIMMTSESITKRGGRIDASVESDLPAVKIDRSRLMQILINLITNATEAYDTVTSASPLALQLQADRNQEGDLRIVIRDNGPGFDASIADELFSRGFSTKDRGSGEGLCGCRRIVAAYDGSIRLESDGPGCGATATIVLPKDLFHGLD